jgi:predicted membrane protein
MLIKFLIFVILIYLFFKIFFRYIFPILLSFFIKKAAQKFVNNMGRYEHMEEEENNINKPNEDANKKNKQEIIGEYVDFEEIK